MAKNVTESDACEVRTAKSLASTGNKGSQSLNALELAKAASASKIMTGVVEDGEDLFGAVAFGAFEFDELVASLVDMKSWIT